MKTATLLLAAAALGLSLSSAFAAPGGIEVQDGVLVDANGMTLYTFDNDEAGVSNCYDQCAVNWPPLTAMSGDMAEGDYTIIDRDDGTRQWAYKGEPLYLWINDVNPGDMTGDGVGGVWHTARE